MSVRHFIAVLTLAGSAFAWPTCNGNWVQVDQGSGPGYYTTGDHLTFQCQTPKPKDPTPTPTTSNSTANSTSAANSISTSNSASNSISTSISSQSQKQQQNQSQSQSATGGTATSTTGDQANSQTTVYQNNQVRQAPPAFAPDVFSTASCRAGGSVGASSPFGGIALGGSKKDKDCEKVAIASGFFARGNAVAGCKLLLSVNSIKGLLTMNECIVTVLPPAPVITQVAPAPPAPIVVVVPQPQPPVVVTEKPQVVNVAPKPVVKKKVVRKSNPCPTKGEK